MSNSPKLILVRDLEGPYDTRRQHARAAQASRERRVSRGVYVESGEWAQLSPDERHLLRVRAIALTRRNPPVLSHWSAAAVHGLPALGGWPDAVHIIVSPTSGRRSRNGVVAHAMRLDESDVVTIDGMLVTSVDRTVVDLAATSAFRDAVAVADAALYTDRRGRNKSMTTPERLRAVWTRMLPFTGHRRAEAVLDFAEIGAATPIESLSRVGMSLIGCPRPTLQVPFFDAEGFIGDTDFGWPGFRAAAEADGARKYLNPAFRGGRSAERVVVDEKVREDRLRAVLGGFTRWTWQVALDPGKLRQKLVYIGLPLGSRW